MNEQHKRQQIVHDPSVWMY